MNMLPCYQRHLCLSIWVGMTSSVFIYFGEATWICLETPTSCLPNIWLAPTICVFTQLLPEQRMNVYHLQDKTRHRLWVALWKLHICWEEHVQGPFLFVVSGKLSAPQSSEMTKLKHVKLFRGNHFIEKYHFPCIPTSLFIRGFILAQLGQYTW